MPENTTRRNTIELVRLLTNEHAAKFLLVFLTLSPEEQAQVTELAKQVVENGMNENKATTRTSIEFQAFLQPDRRDELRDYAKLCFSEG
jgi:hypothetical protein